MCLVIFKEKSGLPFDIGRISKNEATGGRIRDSRHVIWTGQCFLLTEYFAGNLPLLLESSE